jgi:RNA polymerase I-specific transcription initiation factor RRN5
MPCGNCVKRNIAECVYKDTPTVINHTEDRATPEYPTEPKEIKILDAIPEAQLLQPEAMLTLSRTLFMNRSPTIPSPWAHWSEYPSEFTTEPAIYRSAFNDFHTLVVSTTRRLMQTAIMQATSRLRSQRHRASKGILPFVKRRDVLAAVDIVGMKRDGKERWQGVARRCAVRVYEGGSQRDSRRKSRKEIPWEEVEKIMRPNEGFLEPLTTDAETSDTDTSAFKRRAARSGTPLPMHRLALSDSEPDDDDADSDVNMSDADSDDSRFHGIQKSASNPALQQRDHFGRFASLPPGAEASNTESKLQTLEQFDQEASRQEEQTLWEMLQLTVPLKQDKRQSEKEGDANVEGNEKVVTNPDDWRSWTNYRPEWEEFSSPVPEAKFTANQKALPPMPIDATRKGHKPILSSGEQDPRHSKQKEKSAGIELRTQDPRAYAALQGRAAHAAGFEVVFANSKSVYRL